MLGYWKGKYMYDDARVQKFIGHKFTNFSIQIKEFSGSQFSGSVVDDAATGGMDGEGEITGDLIDGRIKFIKKMKRLAIIVGGGKKHRTFNQKHPDLLYSGTLSSDGRRASGTWSSTKKWVWFLIFPIPLRRLTGTWTMELEMIDVSD
jgi:hypothetical protein